MDARSDFIAECDRYEEGFEDGYNGGLAKRLAFHYNNIRETKRNIDGILATYSKDDVVMNNIKIEFNHLWRFLIKEIETEEFKSCPCKRECEF